MTKRSLLVMTLLVSLITILPARADEGMWIPLLLEKLNIKDMQKKGFKLSAEDIYSVNKACMKDAVVIFGGGCTGELISDKGLLITNHHCGYRQIQQHSSVEHDYLTNGFWAMNQKEELANPGLTVKFLKRMEDVTEATLKGVTAEMSEVQRQETINKNIKDITKEAVKDTKYQAYVKPFFYGNAYYLFIQEIYRDVRLVGAPPSAMGKFGGDTDNWMWPRHTADFSLFRIYANKDNQPADYSPENVPFKPAKHFPVSLKGVKEGDFTMVFGYPGSTSRYVPSYHLEMLTQYANPNLIDLRTKKLGIMNADMANDPAVRIKYAAKNASVANSWKRWMGENKGLKKLNAIEKKKTYETAFQKWVNGDTQRSEKYGTLLEDYKKLYKTYGTYYLARGYVQELIMRTGMELTEYAGDFRSYMMLIKKKAPQEDLDKELKFLDKSSQRFFKDYNLETDKKITTMCLEMYRERIPQQFHPDLFETIDQRYKGDFKRFVEKAFQKTIFKDSEALLALLKKSPEKAAKLISNDPLYKIYDSFYQMYKAQIDPQYKKLYYQLNLLNRTYMEAQMAFEKERVFYSDANFTLRVSYGQVKGYVPRDGVYYKPFTTVKGVIEKDNPEIYDYKVPERLKELYAKKDFGRYAENGEVHTCFLATNHTTGGNSGSPVVNAEGHLIGVNFDRAWEGVMSDLMFNPEQCRNISLDIRYALFIIDKFAGAGYLLDEMTIIE